MGKPLSCCSTSFLATTLLPLSSTLRRDFPCSGHCSRRVRMCKGVFSTRGKPVISFCPLLHLFLHCLATWQPVFSPRNYVDTKHKIARGRKNLKIRRGFFSGVLHPKYCYPRAKMAFMGIKFWIYWGANDLRWLRGLFIWCLQQCLLPTRRSVTLGFWSKKATVQNI